jgi:hypothetical protein
MNEDMWYSVFKFILYTKDALNLKNVCKSTNNGFCLYVKNTEKTYPRRTFIKQDTCMTCETPRNKVHVIIYPESYPPRILYYCDRFSCFSCSLKSFCFSMEQENIYPFIENVSKQFYVKRSDGTYSQGILQEKKLYIKNSNVFCNVMFLEKKYGKKKYPIHNITPNNFNLHKLVNVIETDVKILKLFWNVWSNDMKKIINTQLDCIPYTL